MEPRPPQPWYNYVDGRLDASSSNSTHQAELLRSASDHIRRNHNTGSCEIGKTLLMFVEMECSGLGGDMAMLIRAIVIAMARRRQVVLYPPGASSRRRAGLPADVPLSVRKPWHWLVGGGEVADLPLDSIYEKSSCHRLFEEDPQLHAMLSDLSNGSSIAEAAARRGYPGIVNTSRIYGQSVSWRVGLTPGYMPRMYQAQGLLWWFQVVTTHVFRIRGPLARLVQSEPAMRPFIGRRSAPAGRQPSTSELSEDDGAILGWMPRARFDVGLHIRVGDACNNVRDRYYALRQCNVTASLAGSLDVVRRAGVTSGSLFVATNSRKVVGDIEAGVAAPFDTSFAALERGDHLNVATQRLSGATLRRRVLLESLVDLLLLSRARVVAGPMFSSYPRVAIQMRVQTPAVDHRSLYISLDGYPWCSRSSCRMDYMKRFHTA